MTGRIRRLGFVVSGSLALSLSLAACTGAEEGAVRGDASRQPSPSVSNVSGCVVATDLTVAKDGVISAGPFRENQGYWLQEQGTKFWVATSVEQKPTTAAIGAQQLHATEQSVLARRGPGTIAVRDGAPPGLFFPGALRLPQHGTWTITVTIGPDTGCFLVRI